MNGRPLRLILPLIFLWTGTLLAQDGGQDSPLSGSQGTRAVGMGGAVSSWYDEPYALWWNPATLTAVPVGRLSLAHTRNAFDTRTEQFALAFPSLDLGTWAVGGALQTTSDIVITGPLSPTPQGTENFNRFTVGAAYGYPLPLSMKLGATLKISGYRFMGIQRSAWGLDLGLVPYRSPRVQTGIVIQNLLAPTFSYADGLEDQWPRRAILAASVSPRNLILSGQVEFAQRENLRFRLGAEYRPADVLALRAGFDGVGPTAGAGIRYGRFRIDYAMYVPSDLGTEHRLGLSFDIGTPVAEQRRRREAELDYRVEAALQERDETTRRRLEAQADTALAASDWEAASVALAQLQLLFPDDSTYKEGQANVARRRDSSIALRIDSARTLATQDERVSVLRDMVQSQIEARDWRSALQTSAELAAAGAPSGEVDSLNQLATDSLRASVARRVARSSRLLAEGKPAEAAGWAQAALLQDPDDPDAQSALRAARQAGARQQAEAALLEAAAGDDTTAVLSRAQDLLALDPTNPLAQRYLQRYAPHPAPTAITIDELKQDSEAWGWYTQGFVEFRAGRYEESIRLWERVLQRYPGSPDAQKNVEQARLRLESSSPTGDGN